MDGCIVGTGPRLRARGGGKIYGETGLTRANGARRAARGAGMCGLC